MLRVGLGQAVAGWTAFGNNSRDFYSFTALDGAEGELFLVIVGLYFQEKQAEIKAVKL